MSRRSPTPGPVVERWACAEALDTIVRMTTKAHFLVLLGAASRALLFDRDSRLLGEVIEDDGFIVDSLISHAKSCAVPRRGMLEACALTLGLASVTGMTVAVRCFELS